MRLFYCRFEMFFWLLLLAIENDINEAAKICDLQLFFYFRFFPYNHQLLIAPANNKIGRY
jgi:hypothetical protein